MSVLSRFGWLPALLLVAPVGARQDASPPTPAPEDDCEPEDARELLATCDGVSFTRREVLARVEGSLLALEDAVRQARAQELELLVNATLLEREAARHGTTTVDLLRREVLAKVALPTEEEARALYEEHRQRLPGGFGPNRMKLMQVLGQQKEAAAAEQFADRLRARAAVEDRSAQLDLGRTDLPPETVLATLDGAALPLEAVDAKLRPLLAYVEEERYRLQREAVDDMIAELLLGREAGRRGVTVGELLQAEVVPLVQPVTDAQALAFYEENKDRMDADYADPEGRLRILDHLQRAEAERARTVYLERLRGAATIEVFLASPRATDTRLLGHDQPTLGPEEAPATVVVFMDYECTKCARVHGWLRELEQRHEGSLRVVARDFPLSFHEFALTAALAAEAAREQGRYWEYVELLFQDPTTLGTGHLQGYADQLGLDRRRFDDALQSQKFLAAIQQDRGDGLALGVYSTPTVFVDGVRLEDESLESLTRAVEEALRSARAPSGGPSSD